MAEKGKFHISDGRVMPCIAKGDCPLGGEHFPTKAAGEKHLEKENKKFFGLFPELKDAKVTEDTKMKKYIFEDGSEIRGVMLGSNDFYGKYILGEDAKKYYIKKLPPIERETFVKGVDPKVREAIESVKESHEKRDAEIQKIKELENELRIRRWKLDQDIENEEERFKEVYQETSGLYSEDSFRTELSDNVESYLTDRFSKVQHGISSQGPKVWIGGNNMEITIPVDMIRHPNEDDWDFYREYDGTLHSFGSDMTEVVKGKQGRLGIDVDKIKSNVDKLEVAKSGDVVCRTNIGDKTATLDLVVNLQYEEGVEYSQDRIDSIVKEVKSIL